VRNVHKKNVFEYPTGLEKLKHINEKIVANTDPTNTLYRCIKYHKMGGGLSAYLRMLKIEK
jgi:hypothetical protein